MFAKSTKTLITAVAVAFVLAATPPPASEGADDLSTARAGTAQFHQVDIAKASGYGILVRDLAGITCITSPGVGVMGIHYANRLAFGGAVLDPANPEALVSQPIGN